MILYFLRHAKAEPRGPRWRPDSKRPLTNEGEGDMFEVAEGMKTMDISFDVILASPWVRAKRTAEILAEVYDSDKLVETANLTSDAPVKKILDEINEDHASAGEILLVGHEPFMSRLISTLLSGEDSMAIELKKAGLCKLTIGRLFFGKCATLNWLLTAKQLSRMGR